MKQAAVTAPPLPARAPHGPRFGVLVVTANADTRSAMAEVDPQVVQVETIASGTAALTLARTCRFDLMVIDQRLPDMSGRSVVSRLLKEATTATIPFILIGGSVTAGIAFEAIRLSAGRMVHHMRHEHVPLPFTRAAAPIAQIVRGGWSQRRPRSAAERWAVLVLRACESEGDLKTLEDWAAFVGVSYSSLRECCRMVGVPPHEARDFARVLSAVVKGAARRCDPSVLLDVSDSRTLRNLLGKAGLRFDGAFSIEQFVRNQRFIASDNEGLNVLRLLLTAS